MINANVNLQLYNLQKSERGIWHYIGLKWWEFEQACLKKFNGTWVAQVQAVL